MLLQVTKKVPAASTFAKKIQLPCHCSSFCSSSGAGISIYILEKSFFSSFFTRLRGRCSRRLRIPAAGTRIVHIYQPTYLFLLNPTRGRYRPTVQRTTGVIGWIQLSRLGSFSFGSERSPFLLSTDRRTFQAQLHHHVYTLRQLPPPPLEITLSPG